MDFMLNDTFTDPCVGTAKQLRVIADNGEHIIEEYRVNDLEFNIEGETSILKDMNFFEGLNKKLYNINVCYLRCFE